MLVLLLLVTLGLRVVPLAQHRFHEDEALYSSWALLTREDPALISAPVDKPLLHLYLLAGTFRLLGASEVSARLPSLFASVASVAILFALGRALWDEPTALAAAALYAVSPFAILFSPTVFTDPLLVLWMLLGLWAAVAGRPALAGVALGLAYATKQQLVMLAPLVIAMGVHARQTIRPIKQPYGRQALKAIGSFLLVFAGATWWDSLRWHVQPGFWDRSLASYGGLTLVPMGAWPARLRDWTELVGYVFASPILNALLLTLFLGQACQAALRCRAERSFGVDAILLTFVSLYLLLHFAVSFQTWDRYILPLVPLLCLLLARGLRTLFTAARARLDLARAAPNRSRGLRLAAIFLLVLLVRPAYVGATGRLPVGGDHGAYDGIDLLASEMLNSLGPDATLYYHWLGWHFDYYLHGAAFLRVWYPDPATLAEEVSASPGGPSFICFPSWRSEVAVREALAQSGRALVAETFVYRPDGSQSFALYLIDEAIASPDRGDGT
ncbi:MAG TPA: glycosyltransferase family 39 protein [Anaerolineae bacterium]|nr:glycosyltransferase family 39 protein [Anaerolineae bacterium]